jgi:signal transduction histidine kinase
MDLHDGIIQSIYAVGLALDYAHIAIDEDPKMARIKIEQAIDGLNNTIRDIRSYILDLRPRQFRSEDLLAGLQQLVDEFRANSNAKANLIGPKNGLVGLPTQNATALFHICQEALANVASIPRRNRSDAPVEHQRARHPGSDGQRKGFDLRRMSITLGHGTLEHARPPRKVGGDVEITSEPRDGTAVLAWVPRRR